MNCGCVWSLASTWYRRDRFFYTYRSTTVRISCTILLFGRNKTTISSKFWAGAKQQVTWVNICSLQHYNSRVYFWNWLILNKMFQVCNGFCMSFGVFCPCPCFVGKGRQLQIKVSLPRQAAYLCCNHRCGQVNITLQYKVWALLKSVIIILKRNLLTSNNLLFRS